MVVSIRQRREAACRFPVGIALCAAVLGACGPDTSAAPTVELMDDHGVALALGRTFDIAVHEPGGAATALHQVMVSPDDPWFSQVYSAVEHTCRSHIGYDSRFGSDYQRDGAITVEREACGVDAVRESAMWMCIAYELSGMVHAEAPTELRHDPRGEPVLRTRRLVEEIPVADESVVTVPVQDPAGRATLLQLAYSASQNAVLAASQAWDTNVCPDGTLYGRVPARLGGGSSTAGPVSYTALAYVLASNTMESVHLMMQTADAAAAATRAEGITRAGRIPDARAAARQRMVGRHGSVLEAARIMVNVPERHFDPAFGAGGNGIGIGVPIGGMIPVVEPESDLDPCDDGAPDDPEEQVAYALLAGVGLDPGFYGSVDDTVFHAALFDALGQSMGQEVTESTLAQAGTTISAFRPALARLAEEVRVLGRPLAPVPGDDLHRVRGLVRMDRRAPSAFVLNRVADAVVEHPIGPGYAPVASYSPRGLLVEPTQFGQGGMLEALDVVASALGNAFGRADLRAHTWGAPEYREAARLVSLARAVARDQVPMRVRLSVGRPDGGRIDQAVLELFGARRPRRSYALWVGPAGLECASEGTVGGVECDPAQHRVAVDPVELGGATGSGFGDNFLQWHLEPRGVPGGLVAGMQLYVVETDARGAAHAVAAVRLQPGTAEGAFTATTLFPAGIPVIDIVANLTAPSAADCSEPEAPPLVIPLENELQRVTSCANDGDRYESSWACMLSLAGQAVTDTHALGEALIAHGLQMDLRAEACAIQAEQACGGIVDPGDHAFTGEITPCAGPDDCQDGAECIAGACQQTTTSAWASAEDDAIAECVGAQPDVLVSTGNTPLCAWTFEGVPCGGDPLGAECPFRAAGDCESGGGLVPEGAGVPAGYSFERVEALGISSATTSIVDPAVCDAIDWIIAHPGAQNLPCEAPLFDDVESYGPTPLELVVGCPGTSDSFVEHGRFHSAARALTVTRLPWGFGHVNVGARTWLRFGSLTDGPSETTPCGPMYAADEEVRAELCDPAGVDPDHVVGTSGPIVCAHSCAHRGERLSLRHQFGRMVWDLHALTGVLPRIGHIEYVGANPFAGGDEPSWSDVQDALAHLSLPPEYSGFYPGGTSVHMHLAAGWPATLCGDLHADGFLSSPDPGCLDGPYGTEPSFTRWTFGETGISYYGLSSDYSDVPPAVARYVFPWRSVVPEGAGQEEMLLSEQARATLWARGGAIEQMLVRYATDSTGSGFADTRVADFLIDNFPAYFQGSVPDQNCHYTDDDPISAANESHLVCDIDHDDYQDMVEAGHLPAVLGDHTVRDMLSALSLGCRAAAFQGGAVGCPADLDQLPSVSSLDDVPELTAHLTCVQERLDQTAANIVVAVPQSVVDAFNQEGTPLAPGASHGQHTAISALVEQDLRDLGAALRAGTTAVRDFRLAVERVGLTRQITDSQIQSAHLQNVALDIQQVHACAMAVNEAAQSWAGMFGPNLVKADAWAQAGGATTAAVSSCSTGLALMDIAAQQEALSEDIYEAQFQQALLDLVAQYAGTMDALRNAIDGLHAAASALQGHLAELEMNRHSAARAVACATFADEAAEQEFPVNTVMRRVMDIRRGQYERSLESSRFYLRLARAAIEEHFGVDLESLQSPLCVGCEAPATWANDVETLVGIDYALLRDATEGDTIDWSRQTPMLYYEQLANFVVQYQLAYNFQDEESTAVFSLRDDILQVREECEQESYNALLSSDDWNAATWTPWAANDPDGDGTPEREVWAAAAAGAPDVFRYRYTAGGGYLVRPTGTTVPYDLHASCAGATCETSTTGGFGQGDLELRSDQSYALSWIEPVDLGGTIASASASCTSQTIMCGNACATDPEGTTCQVSCSGWTCGAACSDLASAECGACQAALVEECVQAACAETPVASTSAVQALLDEAPLPAATYLDAGHDGWIDVCRYRRVVVAIDHPSSGLHRVGFRPADLSDPAAPDVVVGIAAPQLERRSSAEIGIAPEPRAYFGTDEDGLRMVPVCTDDDGSTLRTDHFTYGCEWVCPWGLSDTPCAGQRRCYYETTFDQSHAELDHLRTSPFVHGSYNYRFRTLALNVVGLGTRLCDRDGTSSSCHGTGYVPFALHHDGPFFTRNHFGEEHQSLLYAGRVQGSATAMERYVTNPVTGNDAALLDVREELAGRPLTGHFRLRIYDTPELNWDAVEDIQLVVDYRYWTRTSR